MKKIILHFIVACLLFSAAGLFAVPQYYNYNNGTSFNSFPFNVAAGKMVQTLIAPGEFNQPAPAANGNITKYSVFISPGFPLGPVTYTNFRILFMDTTLTVLPAAFVNGNWDTVFFRASYGPISAGASTWLDFTLDHAHTYNNTRSLVIQIEHCGATGTFSGNSLVQSSTPGMNRRIYSGGACPFAYGGATTSVVNCGITLTEVPVIPNNNEIPTEYYLEQNYPNPFNPVTSIKFSVPKTGFVTLKIHDALGNTIAELVNENISAGNYEIKYDASKFPSGIYFYTLSAGEFAVTKKMTLIK